jgi:hypothetical protein
MILSIVLLFYNIPALVVYAKLKGAALIISRIIGIVAIASLMIGGVYFVVYFGIRLSLGIFACVLEDKGPVNSLKRSFTLVKQRVNPVVGVFFAIIVGIGILCLPIMLLNFVMKDPKQVNILTIILQFAAGLIATPVSSAVLVSLYQQLKDLNA